MSRKTKSAGRVGGAKDGATAKAPKRAKKEAQTITASDVGSLDAVLGENSTSEQNVVDLPAQSAVESETSSPDASAIPAMTTPAPKIRTQGEHMDLTLTRGKLSKNGKKVTFTNPALIAPLVFPVRAFSTVPEALTLSGDGFTTRSAEEQAKAEARNAKRAAKGLKPKATPAERAQALAARAAKLQAKLERAQAASAKLAAKLGTAAPGASAATSEAPAAQ